MEFVDFESMLTRILALEFGDRDRELDTSAVRLKGKMNARGVLASTLTLQELSTFFVAEFKARCDLIAQHIIGKIGTFKQTEASSKRWLDLFRSESEEQLARLAAKFEAIAAPISSSLQSAMPDEIRNVMLQRMRDHMQRNDLMIELEDKVATAMKPQEIFALKPTVYGVGIDLRALWRRYFR